MPTRGGMLGPRQRARRHTYSSDGRFRPEEEVREEFAPNRAPSSPRSSGAVRNRLRFPEKSGLRQDKSARDPK